MRLINYLLLAILMTLTITGCGQGTPVENDGEVVDSTQGNESEKNEDLTPIDSPQAIEEVQADERVVKMVTNKGEITIKLFPKYAPLAVENFITHSENGYYEGIIFHRVMEGFMVQGGDPTGTGMGGESVFGGSFEDEFSPSLAHVRGALSMANSGPNTNGSQFFIVHAQEGTPHLDGAHTVFGQVIKGMDVVDDIAETEVGPDNRPIDDIIIESIEIVQ